MILTFPAHHHLPIALQRHHMLVADLLDLVMAPYFVHLAAAALMHVVVQAVVVALAQDLLRLLTPFQVLLLRDYILLFLLLSSSSCRSGERWY